MRNSQVVQVLHTLAQIKKYGQHNVFRHFSLAELNHVYQSESSFAKFTNHEHFPPTFAHLYKLRIYKLDNVGVRTHTLPNLALVFRISDSLLILENDSLKSKWFGVGPRRVDLINEAVATLGDKSVLFELYPID